MESLEESWVGRYQILRRLGQGGMGQVFLAQDTALSRPVALKMISYRDRDPARAQWLRSRLFHEARAAAALAHPTLVSVYDIGEISDDLYIVMEYVVGESLQDLAAKGISPEEVLRVVTQTAAGLDYAHSHGVVHRDIKPANIVVEKDGNVKVVDFGLAKMLSGDTRTATGIVVGTLEYMAPEQLLNDNIAGHTDQYSLAAMAYALLTGGPVFDATSVPALLNQITNRIPERADVRRPGLPRAVGDVIARGLDKDPARRYPTCTAFATELAKAVVAPAAPSSTPVFEGPPPAPSMEFVANRPLSGKPWIFAGVLLTCLLAWFALSRPKPAPVATTQPAPAAPESPPQAPPSQPVPQQTEPVVRQPATPETKSARAMTPKPVAQDGRLIWTGDLDAGQQLDMTAAASGTTGSLPGVPVNIEVHPPSIHVVVAPGPDNGWKKLVVRNDGSKRVAIIVEWSVIRKTP